MPHWQHGVTTQSVVGCGKAGKRGDMSISVNVRKETIERARIKTQERNYDGGKSDVDYSWTHNV